MSDDELRKKLYVPNIEEWLTDCQIKFYSDRQLTVKIIKSGLILPPILKKNRTYLDEYSGGVCDEHFNFVDGFFRCKAPGNTNEEVRSSYKCNAEEIYTVDEDVIWGGVLIGHFGHLMLECLGKMWYILQNPLRKEKIAFVIIGKKVKNLFIKFFNLLDISEERVLFIDKPTKFNSIIVPESSSHSQYEYTKEYLMPYRYICNKIKPSTYKKIYLTKKNFGNSDQTINEEYFEEYFAKQGYKVISPEKLSLEEQISLISGADELAATLGTLTHWALFCKPGTKFTMLVRRSNDLLISQCLINEATKIDWYIVDISVAFLSSGRNSKPYFLGETIYWKQYIQDYFDDLIFSDNWKKYLFEYILQWGEVNLNPKCEDKNRYINFVRSLDVMSFLRPLYNLLKCNGLSYELKDYLDTDLDKFSAKYGLENIIIFGAGNWGKNLVTFFKQSKYSDMKLYFCDNDPNKWGKIIPIGGG